MIFTLKLSETDYRYEEIKQLEKLGFKFKKNKPTFANPLVVTQYKPKIELNTIDELLAFSKKWGELIIYKKTVEIYNGYRE